MLKRSSDNRLNGGQVIVDYLIREKVPYAFGLCGHGNIQFIDALLCCWAGLGALLQLLRLARPGHADRAEQCRLSGVQET